MARREVSRIEWHAAYDQSMGDHSYNQWNLKQDHEGRKRFTSEFRGSRKVQRSREQRLIKQQHIEQYEKEKDLRIWYRVQLAFVNHEASPDLETTRREIRYLLSRGWEIDFSSLRALSPEDATESVCVDNLNLSHDQFRDTYQSEG